MSRRPSKSRRRLPGRPPPPARRPGGNNVFSRYQLLALFCSLLLHGVSAMAFAGGPPMPGESAGWPFQFYLLIVVSSALGVVVFLLRRSEAAFILIGIQVLVLAVLNYPRGGDTVLTWSLVGAVLLELSAWFRIGPLAYSIAGTAVAALLSVRPIPAWNGPGARYSAFGLCALAAAAACFGVAAWNLSRIMREAERERRRARGMSRSISSLIAANLGFQRYAIEVEERSTIEERKRISRDIHDVVGYTLVNLRMMLEAGIDMAGAGNEKLRELLAQARDQAQNGLVEARRVLRDYRDMDAARAEGVLFIRKLTAYFSMATGVRVRVDYGNIPRSFGPELDAAVYHVVQESMTNAVLHGRAEAVRIGFWISEGRLLIRIDDDGKGASEIKPGIGLSGMKERLEPLGGSIEARGGASGFTVMVEIPLSPGMSSDPGRSGPRPGSAEAGAGA